MISYMLLSPLNEFTTLLEAGGHGRPYGSDVDLPSFMEFLKIPNEVERWFTCSPEHKGPPRVHDLKRLGPSKGWQGQSRK